MHRLLALETHIAGSPIGQVSTLPQACILGEDTKLFLLKTQGEMGL